MTMNPPRYKPIRAVTRAFDLLAELGRHQSATPADLATATGIDRGTVYRLLETLKAKGIVCEEAQGGGFRLASGVRRLADGYQSDDSLACIVAGELGALMQKMRWPTTYAVFDRGTMLVREETHRFSAFTVEPAVLGKRRPLFASALGRAALAWATPDAQGLMIRLARTLPGSDPDTLPTDAEIGAMVATTRARGHAEASSIVATGVQIGSIALPLKLPDHQIAALSLEFYRSVLSPAAAVRTFLRPLQETVWAIERATGSDAD